MGYTEKDIIYENGAAWVLHDTIGQRYTVLISGVTHSITDSSYTLDADGLSIAKKRADYLADRIKGRFLNA